MSQVDQKLIIKLFPKADFYLYIPGLAHVLGSAKTAVLVSYLLFWNNKGANKSYVYKTVKEMKVETGLTKNEQKTSIDVCIKHDFLHIAYKGIPRKRYFALDVLKLEKYVSSHPKTNQLANLNSDTVSAENGSTNTDNNKEISDKVNSIYETFLNSFGLSRDSCTLTAKRRLIIIERIADLGYERMLHAIRAAASNDFYNGADDGIRKVTLESLFQNYESAENFSNMEIHDEL